MTESGDQWGPPDMDVNSSMKRLVSGILIVRHCVGSFSGSMSACLGADRAHDRWGLRLHGHQSSPEDSKSETWKAIKMKNEIIKNAIWKDDGADRLLASGNCQRVFF